MSTPTPPAQSSATTAPATAQHRAAPWWRIPAVAVAVVAVLLAGAGAAGLAHPPGRGATTTMAIQPAARIPASPRCGATVAGSATITAAAPAALRANLPTVPVIGDGQPARPVLAALTARIAAAPPDQAGCPVAYVRLRIWAADDTITPPVITRDVVVYDQDRWRAADDSGRITTTRLSATGPASGTTDYGPGQLPDTFPAPMSSDPPILASELNAVNPWSDGHRAAIHDLADVYLSYHPDRAVRAALVQVLADTDDLTTHGTATDPLGRTGTVIAVTSDAGATRDILILNDDGWPLAYTQTRQDRAGLWHLAEYRLFAQNATSATVG